MNAKFRYCWNLDPRCHQHCIGCPPIYLDVVSMYNLAYHFGSISTAIVGSKPIAPSIHPAIHEYRLPANNSFFPTRRRHGCSGISCRPIHSCNRILYLVLSGEHDEALISHIQWSLPLQEASSFEQAARRPYFELHRHN
jgi:hypothetical protein